LFVWVNIIANRYNISRALAEIFLYRLPVA
jgi:hypothetical protein